MLNSTRSLLIQWLTITENIRRFKQNKKTNVILKALHRKMLLHPISKLNLTGRLTQYKEQDYISESTTAFLLLEFFFLLQIRCLIATQRRASFTIWIIKTTHLHSRSTGKPCKKRGWRSCQTSSLSFKEIWNSWRVFIWKGRLDRFKKCSKSHPMHCNTR